MGPLAPQVPQTTDTGALPPVPPGEAALDRVVNRSLVWGTGLYCAAVLTLSTQPGLALTILNVSFLLSCIIIPAFVLVAMVAGAFAMLAIADAVLFSRASVVRIIARHGRSASLAIALLIITAASLKLCLPLRLAVAASRAPLERIVASTPAGDMPTRVGRFVGLIFVSEILVESSGTAYLLTHHRNEVLSPDVIMDGLAYLPSGDGVPFGLTSRHFRKLGKAWYRFHAWSN